VFFQLSGPTTYSWIGLAQGSKMTGANYFIMYTDSSGKNVTISPRAASGMVMPTYNSATQFALLAGSGVSNGVMTANVKCSNCQSWSGGKMDFSSSSTSWVYAALQGSPLNSDSQTAPISIHSDTQALTFDSSAQGGNDVNPFFNVADTVVVTSACSATGTTSSVSITNISAIHTTISTSTTKSLNQPLATVSQTAVFLSATGTSFAREKRSSIDYTAEYLVKRATSPGCSSAIVPDPATSNTQEEKMMTILAIHSFVATAVFCLAFPIGGIMIRLMSFRGLLWLHGIWQSVSYLFFIIASGLGIYMANAYVSNLPSMY
jgi:hypothetical protein